VLTKMDILDILLHVAKTAQPLQINEKTFRKSCWQVKTCYVKLTKLLKTKQANLKEYMKKS